MKPNLLELVDRWQGLLRLRDWQLDVRYVTDLAAPDGSPCFGLCSRFVDAKRARILIRDPETSAALSDSHDIEDTVVHELLHLHFAPLAEDTPAGIAAEEQAVWAISGAFTALGKDSGQQARFARAVVATARRARNTRSSRKETHMLDPVLLAALKAAAASDDPKVQIEALISGLEGGGGGEKPPPAAEQAAEGGAATEEEDPKPPVAQRAGAPTVRVPASHLATRAQVAEVAAKNATLAKQITSLGIERVLDKRPDLSDVQRTFARSLASTDEAERYLKSLPLPSKGGDGEGDGEASAGTTRARGTAPTQGAGRGAGAPTADAQAMHRQMGLRNLGGEYVAPYRREDGAWVHPLNRPQDVRAFHAGPPAGKGG